MQDKERISRDLAAVVGTDGVVVDPDELRVYETDGLTVFKARPDIVVLPHSAEEVARVVEVCHREKCPFVARGAEEAPLVAWLADNVRGENAIRLAGHSGHVTVRLRTSQTLYYNLASLQSHLNLWIVECRELGKHSC